MKITPTSVTLSLILHSIDHIILPDVTAKALRDQLGYIRLAVDDLLKRHGPLYDYLYRLNSEGLEIERSTLRFLDNHDSHHVHAAHSRNFDEAWEEHASLTERLDQLCKRLINEKSKDPCTDKMLWDIAAWEVRYYQDISKISSEPFKDGRADELELTMPLTKELAEKVLVEKNGPLKVLSLSRHPNGFSKQTYFVTLEYHDGKVEDLVIRLTDYAPLLEINSFDLAREFDLLVSLNKIDFPCPKPRDLLCHPKTKKPLFFTMEKLPGTMISPFVSAHSANVDEKVWLELAELLAKLHCVPLETFDDFVQKHEPGPVVGLPTSEYYGRQVKLLSTYLKTKPHLESPTITWAVRWLQKNIPEDTRPLVLVHGDFNVHNILAEGDKVTAVLDWETSLFGSAEHDLAYIKPHVSQHIDWDKFVAHYIAHGGREPRTKDMPFYTAFAWTLLTIGASQLHSSIYSGRNRDIRYVMCEQAFSSIFMGTTLECTRTNQSFV